MATKEELLKRKRKNIENLKKKNKENLLVSTIKMPFRGAGHIARTVGSTAMMPIKGAGHVLRTAADTATMPLRGARNVVKLGIGTARLGGKIGYGITDKAIKGGKSFVKEMNKQSARSKERRKQEGIGEYATKPKPKTKPKTETKKTTPKSSDKTTKSNVFTKHYKTGKELGVMTRSERRRYDKEAAGRTYKRK